MDFKSLFINSDENEKPKQKEVVNTGFRSMPTSSPSIPTQSFGGVTSSPQPISTDSESQKILETIKKTYENGFESLNKPGYDFYEYFKSIKSINGTSSDHYMMAFTLGKSMMENLSSESLSTDGQFYLDELNKAYTSFDNEGKFALGKLSSSRDEEKKEITKNIDSLHEQITQLQLQLDEQTLKFNSIDMKFEKQMNDTQLKLQINDQVKNELTNEIGMVITNIKNFIK